MSIGLNVSTPGDSWQLLLLHGIGILNHSLPTDNRISMHHLQDVIIDTVYIDINTIKILLNEAYISKILMVEQ